MKTEYKYNISIPPRYKKRYDNAMKSNSRKEKIRMNCLACVGFVPSEVVACTDKECLFWKLRLKG